MTTIPVASENGKKKDRVDIEGIYFSSVPYFENSFDISSDIRPGHNLYSAVTTYRKVINSLDKKKIFFCNSIIANSTVILSDI